MGKWDRCAAGSEIPGTAAAADVRDPCTSGLGSLEEFFGQWDLGIMCSTTLTKTRIPDR